MKKFLRLFCCLTVLCSLCVCAVVLSSCEEENQPKGINYVHAQNTPLLNEATILS